LNGKEATYLIEWKRSNILNWMEKKQHT